jgi:hypothetical protein
MSRLGDLKSHIGKTVYFSRTLLSVSGDSATVRKGTLEKIEGPVCVVEWDECLCLDEHNADVACKFRIRDMVSIFLVQVNPPRARAAS